ncbi:MAG TPA: ribose 5-phosphate isomerase A [Tepidisphaeraceae bacterium]|jgi:ribose 5-phosphate isomerase A
MDPKQHAAEAALAYIQSNMIIGLGTGSTAAFFIQALAQALRQGKLSNVHGIPTSLRSEKLAGDLGIPLSTLSQHPQIDVTVDGADEVTDDLNAIKGLGGALLREKIVAQNTRRFVIIVDSNKHVDQLFSKSPLPVEVAPFAHEAQERFLKNLGGNPVLRLEKGKPYITDNGNLIYDCRFAPGRDPQKVNAELAARAGIVESGLFLGMAAVALIADDQKVRTVSR